MKKHKAERRRRIRIKRRLGGEREDRVSNTEYRDGCSKVGCSHWGWQAALAVGRYILAA